MIAVLVLAASARVLTLGDALATAAAHQPQIIQARATTEVYQARANEARAPLLPQLNGNGSYSRRTSNFVPQPGTNTSNMSGANTPRCPDGTQIPPNGICAQINRCGPGLTLQPDGTCQ